ncbi:hypothetical protein BJY01DRAFT_255667 [Aspergillus pseudoustus]|uniref:Uncharacterized protein n=1 Tax=Aspergillus pseudoustus TaxID=1810923 RepID=A0ABR4II88_9EURO
MLTVFFKHLPFASIIILPCQAAVQSPRARAPPEYPESSLRRTCCEGEKLAEALSALSGVHCTLGACGYLAVPRGAGEPPPGGDWYYDEAGRDLRRRLCQWPAGDGQGPEALQAFKTKKIRMDIKRIDEFRVVVTSAHPSQAWSQED